MAPWRKNCNIISYICIIVNFQPRSVKNAGLTECSLYDKFCIERSPKMGCWGIFGTGAKIFGGNPTNVITADLRRLVKKKLRRCSK